MKPSSKNNKKPAKASGKKTAQAPAVRRQYDSPLRRQQAADTRERIIAAGAEIAHRLPNWDWSALTFKAVGERAGVSERTVHRYIATERQLREAVLQRLFQESGISLQSLKLDSFGAVATRIFEYMSSFTIEPNRIADPAFVALDQQRRAALVGTVSAATPQWSDSEREIAAATLDILWHPPFYERLTNGWGFDSQRATQTIGWISELLQHAIREDLRPGKLGKKRGA